MSERRKSILYMLVAAFFFCFTEICYKKIDGDLNCIQANFSRYLLASILLCPVALNHLKKRGVKLTSRHWAMGSWLGFIGITLVAPPYQVATVRLSAGISSVLFSCNPLFIAFLAGLILKEPVRSRQKQALAIQILSILILVNPLHNTLDGFGLALMFMTIVLYSLYGVQGKKLTAEIGSVALTFLNFLCGGLQMLAIALLSYIPAVAAFLQRAGLGQFACVPLFSGYSLRTLPWVLILYLGVTIAAVLCWFLAMEHGGTAIGSLTYFIKPALAPVLALVFVGEAITGRMLAGMSLMVFGALWALLPEKKNHN